MNTTVELSSEGADRLTIHRLAQVDTFNTFSDDVRSGLTANPKTVPPKYFYDSVGSHLFEAICCLPEYYVSRAEAEILREHTEEMILAIGGDTRKSIRLVELGSGSAEKTRHFIKLLLARQEELHYLPVDISDSSVDRTCQRLLFDYPALRITAYAAEYSAALRALASSATIASDDSRTVVLFLGSSIGNLDPEESLTLLRQIRQALRPGEALFFGADLKKSAAVLVPAYSDAIGVTAAFNLNLLVRINRELDGDFNVMKFEHRAIYDEALGRIEMHLFSREPQRVRLRKIELEISFDEGESIHTENSYKFEISQLAELARTTGFSLEETWYDRDHMLSLNLFVARQ